MNWFKETWWIIKKKTYKANKKNWRQYLKTIK